MEPVVGIFPSRSDAVRAAGEVRAAGFSGERVQLLLPIEAPAGAPPSEEAEQPGVGLALGGVVGAATGATAGLGLGAITASFLLPGIGPVAAVGLATAAAFGVAGAIGGATAGAALDAGTRSGIPKDELYLYEHALARGKGVLFVLVDSQDETKRAGEALDAAGAESLDAARKDWWVGIEDLQRADTRHEPGRHARPPAETVYRKGFLAALHPDNLDRAYATVAPLLWERLGEIALDPGFRHGYERGMDVARVRARELTAGGRK
jgi:hypothetical protein